MATALIALRYLPFVGIMAAAIAFAFMRPERLSELSVHWGYLTAACITLYAAFLGRALVWWRFQRQLGVEISKRDAVGAFFLAALTKYIPGKVWSLLSIASKTSESGAPLGVSIVQIAWYQVCVITAGLVVGAGALVAVNGFAIMGLGGGVICLVVAGVVFSSPVIVERLVQPLLVRLKVQMGSASIPSIRLLFDQAGLWLAIAAGFWLLFAAVGQGIPLLVALVQPLANSAGMLVPFTPAGLGVREAVGAAYLGQHFSDVGQGLVLATLARVWFLGVEVLIFSTGLWLCRNRVKQPKRNDG